MRVLASFKPKVSYHKSGIIKACEPIIYKVISKTQNYPTFIPFVNSSQIIKKISDNQNYTKLTISYSTFTNLSYTSHVKMHQANKIGQKSWVHSYCKDQPLKKLNSVWEITGKDNNTSHVNYKLDFQFTSPLYQLASSVLKDYMGDQMWNLFQKQSIIQQTKQDRAKNQAKLKETVIITSDQDSSELNSIDTLKNRNLNIEHENRIMPQECKISRLAQFLNENQDLKKIYEQNSSNRSKIQQYHYRLESSPDYQISMKTKIANLVKEKLTHFQQ